MIEDTSKREPVEHIVGALAQGTSGYIEGIEAAGQRQLVNSMQIPVSGPAADLEALGFKLGPVEEGALFRDCELPEGWSREGSDHAMWSYIVDERGYRRVAIFYKAAFYDRRADFHIESEPCTQAQADAWEAVQPKDMYSRWMGGKSRREGDNYVYAYRGRYGDQEPPEGKHAYSDDGRRYEVVVAADGTVLERTEFTVEPTEDW